MDYYYDSSAAAATVFFMWVGTAVGGFDSGSTAFNTFDWTGAVLGAILFAFWGFLGRVIMVATEKFRNNHDDESPAANKSSYMLVDRALSLAWMSAFMLSIPGIILGAMLSFLTGIENAAVYGMIIAACFGAVLGGVGSMVGSILDHRAGRPL